MSRTSFQFEVFRSGFNLTLINSSAPICLNIDLVLQSDDLKTNNSLKFFWLLNNNVCIIYVGLEPEKPWYSLMNRDLNINSSNLCIPITFLSKL